MNAKQDSIKVTSTTNLSADEITLIEAYRSGRAEQATAEQEPPTAPPAESVEDVERKILLAKFKQLSPESRAGMLTTLREEVEREEAKTAPPTLPDYVIAQIVMPLAAILITKVIDPIDMYQQKYQFSEMVDWMADVLPAALNECDSVALIDFLEKSIG